MNIEDEVNDLVVEIIKAHEKINPGKGIAHSIITLKVFKRTLSRVSEMPKGDESSYKLWKIRTCIDKNIDYLTPTH